MKVEALRADKIKCFTDFCKKHRDKVDESNLYEEDLNGFTIDEENPTYLITEDKDNIIAATSLIINEYNRKGKRARFRIFYSEINSHEYYEALLREILKHCVGLSKIFLYIKIDNDILMQTFHDLGFLIERYSYVLIRDNEDIPLAELPEGFSIRAFVKGQDEDTWRDIRNVAFAKLQGCETPITREDVEKLLLENEHIDGGMKILCHIDIPVGIVRGTDDNEEGEPILLIGTVAIIPEYQGRGLGKSLLRDIMCFAKKLGYKKSILCVNAENENASKLYINEGFKKLEGVACFIFRL